MAIRLSTCTGVSQSILTLVPKIFVVYHFEIHFLQPMQCKELAVMGNVSSDENHKWRISYAAIAFIDSKNQFVYP